MELNRDLLYANDSCRPSLVFDMQRWEVRVSEAFQGGLKEEDELTFFYPSTEWAMAQPLECGGGVEECVGQVSGARNMDRNVLERYRLNEHVTELLEERATEGRGEGESI
jgi:hypothetical protein